MCPAVIRLRSHCAQYGSFSLKYAAKALSPFSFASSQVRAGSALPIPAYVDSKIRPRQFVPALAMGLPRVAAHLGFAALNVHRVRDCFEMVWIHAPWVLAPMVDFHPVRNFASIQPIGNSVSLFGALAVP
jgi:hypothetical protein